MFLYERLFGIACYLLALLFVFYVIYYKKLRVKDALIFYVLVLAVMAYFYEPHETADLYRIRNIIGTISRYDFSEFSKLFLTNNSSGVGYCLFWLVGKTGNANLLPAIAALITYSSIFYILYKSSVLYRLERQGVAIILVFIMSTSSYMMAISGIRCMLSVALLCLCVFRESLLKTFKWWHIVLYGISALLHNLAVVLIVVRCITFVLFTRLKTTWKALFIILLTAGYVYVFLKYEWLLTDVYNKALGYVTGDSYSYIWEYIIAFLSLLIELYVLKMSSKCRDENLTGIKRYVMLCVLIACIFVGQFSIFQRIITYIVPILSIPFIANGFVNHPRRVNMIKTVLYMSLITLAVTCTRGELCSLKFFVLK